jgi:predicted porin
MDKRRVGRLERARMAILLLGGLNSVLAQTASSIMGDYLLTKRFDTYAGMMWSNVSHGLANGYLNTTNLNPTIGLRFSF